MKVDCGAQAITLLCFLSILTCSCSVRSGPKQAANHARKYGLSETARYRLGVELSIEAVNNVLGEDVKYRLVPSWSPFWLQSFAFIENSGQFRVVRDAKQGKIVFENAVNVPVYLLDDDSLADLLYAFVPDGEVCVFINARSFDGLYRRFYVNKRGSGQEFFFNRTIAVILLHEVGHLHFQDNCSPHASAEIDLAELNLASSQIKNTEVRADVFAAEQIGRANKLGDRGFVGSVPGRTTSATQLYLAIVNATHSHDLDVDPLGVFDGKPRVEVFRATGESHLNLYLRLNVMERLLDPSPQERNRIETIVSAIDKATKSGG